MTPTHTDNPPPDEHPANPTTAATSTTSARARPRVLAIASAGGHWEQLRRLSGAFHDCDVTFVSTSAEVRTQLGAGARFRSVIDANAWTKFRMAAMLVQTLLLVVRLRPGVIVTTGAAPGYFAVRFGKLVGARTLWVDSIANAEELSRSGRLAGRHATFVASQWKHVAEREGVRYEGAVL
jgi:UDP-N-acetylglucosamine:LPS N-acetylglucosamine transferase